MPVAKTECAKAGQHGAGRIAFVIFCALVPVAGIAQCPNENVRVFAATGAVQTFVVPVGVIALTIQAVGAGGGSGVQFLAGRGTSVQGDFVVVPGETLQIVVGSKGEDTFGSGGGGGGGSFVASGATLASSTTRIVAGGGGGASSDGIGVDAVTATSGTPGNGGGGPGGADGSGGAGGRAGGGGGFLTNGGNGVTSNGGLAIINGATGGAGGDSGGDGGFGGGGEGGGTCGNGGGGGGYSGGGGGACSFGGGGGGGGSFNAGTNQTNTAATNAADGSVTFCWAGNVPVGLQSFSVD